MLLRDLIVINNEVTVICKGFIDSIAQYKQRAILWPYLNEQAINDVYGLLMYTLANMPPKYIDSLFKFGDELDSFFTEQYSDDIRTITWGDVQITPDMIQALIGVTQVFNTWRTNNGWEDPGWITDDMSKYENITVTTTDKQEDIPYTPKNKYDNVPPYVLTTETKSKSTLVVIMQPNKTGLTMPLLNIAVHDLGFEIEDNNLLLYPAIGIGVTAASILFTTLQILRIPVRRESTDKNFEFALKIICNFSQIVESNIKILTEENCHPRLRKHAVIKYVSNDIMISTAKVIEASF